MKNVIERAYKQCREILQRDEAKLHKIVDFLMEHETMSGAQFVQCMNGEEISASGDVSLLASFNDD